MNPSDATELTISASEAAHQLGITESHVHLLVRSGQLQFVATDPGDYEITVSSVDDYERKRAQSSQR